MKWYCVYTKQKKEDSVCQLLASAGFNCFNPKIKRKKYFRNKIKEIIESLFPCYIFTSLIYPKHYKLITYTRGVRKIVGFPKPKEVPLEIINFFQQAEVEGYIKIKKNFKAGEKVEIFTGPFKGLLGVFDHELKGSERVAILLNTLSSARVVIDKEFISRA